MSNQDVCQDQDQA